MLTKWHNVEFVASLFLSTVACLKVKVLKSCFIFTVYIIELNITVYIIGNENLKSFRHYLLKKQLN